MQFSEFIIANVRLYALRDDFPLSTPAVANFTRNELATALRKVRCCCSNSRVVRSLRPALLQLQQGVC